MKPRSPALRAPAPRLAAARILLHALLLAACNAAPQQPQPAQVARGLLPAESFVGSEPDGQKAVFAPQVVLGGTLLRVVPAAEAGECAAACRAEPRCGWFNYCGEQVSRGGGGEVGGRRRARAAGSQQAGQHAKPALLTPALAPCRAAATPWATRCPRCPRASA